MYTAADVAKYLASQGFKVKGSTEGDDTEDGEVQLTELVSVQVGTYGNYCMVVKYDRDAEGEIDAVTHYPTCRTPVTLPQYIRSAMGMEGRQS